MTDHILKLTIKLMFLVLVQTMVNAQSITSISGTVMNTDNEPMFGDAFIISPQDSTIIKGTSYFEGKFQFLNINDKNVLLKLTSLEFEDTYISIPYSGETDIDLGNIIVKYKENEIQEVVVVAKLPRFETKADGTVQVNVENTVLATSNSVLEILSHSPNVFVDEVGISVIGKGQAIIYLNGKLVLSEQLTNIQASEIKKIEIISNPSAKYDAEGQAVINIITKTGTAEGIKGQFSQNVSISKFSPTNTNTNLSLDYRKERISITGNYGMQLGAYRFLLNTTRRRDEAGDVFNSDITTDWIRNQDYFGNYGMGIQHNFDDSSYFSISYNGLANNLGGTETSNNTITYNGEQKQFESMVYKNNLTTQNGLVINYLKALDTLGSSVYIGGQYSLFKTKIDDIIDEASVSDGQETNRTLNNLVDRKIPIFSAQLDYTKAFSKQSQLEAGIKTGRVSNNSYSDFLVLSGNESFILDENLSTDFEYNEQIYAAYISYKMNPSEKLNYSFGLRSELTTYNLATDNIGEKIENTYFNLFPSASLGIDLGEKKSFFASFASRISRVSYQALNPTIIYQDAFTSIQGNPNLIPEKIYSFETGISTKRYSLKIGYNYTTDPITGGALEGEDPKTYVLQSFNSTKQHDIFANFSLPINTNWWSSMNTITLSYNKLIDNQSSFGFMNAKPQAYLYSNNKFNLFKGFKLQLIAWYLSDRYDGLFFRKNQAEITLGLEKDLFNKSLKLQVVANDIFQTNKPDGNYSLGNTLILFDRVNNTQYFRFMATYNFGKLKKSNYQRKSSGEEETQRF